MQEEYDLMVADHAWVDQDDEMDYDYVPFSDETTTSLIPTASGSLLAALSVAGSPLPVPPGTEEDPVIKALRQRQQLEKQEARPPPQRAPHRAPHSSTERKEEALTAPAPAPAPAAPSMSWRTTARPVVAETPKPPAITIAQRPAPEEGKPRGPSALDMLISSIKNAAKCHVVDPEASSRMLLFGEEKEETMAPAAVEPAAPVAKMEPPVRQKTLVVRLEVGKAPVQTRFTILGPHREAPHAESTGKVQFSARHPLLMTALHVHK